MTWSNYREVTMVKRGDDPFTMAFSDCDDACVGPTKRQINVRFDQARNSMQVITGQDLHRHLTFGHKPKETGLSARA
jgi:hypothetical protein